MDAQGAERARPYLDKANAAYPAVVDAENQLGRLYGFKAIPNGLLVDEEGVLRYKRLGGFDIRKAETASVLKEWLAGSDLSQDADGRDASAGPEHSRSNALFREGLELYRAGEKEPALELWRKGLAIDPANYIIRKQIWAVENPDRFYEGDVDYAWQREQMDREVKRKA